MFLTTPNNNNNSLVKHHTSTSKYKEILLESSPSSRQKKIDFNNLDENNKHNINTTTIVTPTAMPASTNISPLLPNNTATIVSPLSTNVSSISAKKSHYYYADSDSDDISKSFICSSLNASFRKKRNEIKQRNKEKQQDESFTDPSHNSHSHSNRHLTSKEDRWNTLSKYAIDHNKNIDPSILDLTHLQQLQTPEMLRFGITPNISLQILELRIHSHIIENGCGWPHFLDTVSTLLINLKHLQCWYPDEYALSKPYCNDYEYEQKRMLRLYIIYRLPDLQSINEEYITDIERCLARPNTPTGMPVNRDDWCTQSMIQFNYYTQYSDTCSIITTDDDDSNASRDFNRRNQYDDDDLNDEIGVEVIANTTNINHKSLELEIEEQDDEEIMHMVQNVLVKDFFNDNHNNKDVIMKEKNKNNIENTNIILENDNSIEITNKEQSLSSDDEKEYSYISFRTNAVSPSPPSANNHRPPKHPSRRRHGANNTTASSLSWKKKKNYNKNIFNHSQCSSSIIDQSSDGSSCCSGNSSCSSVDIDEEYWI